MGIKADYKSLPPRQKHAVKTMVLAMGAALVVAVVLIWLIIPENPDPHAPVGIGRTLMLFFGGPIIAALAGCGVVFLRIRKAPKE